MKVLIALASSSGQLSGVPRHAINLARCLLTRLEIAEVHLVAAPWQQDFVLDTAPRDEVRLRLHAAPIGSSALSRNLWFYAQLPRLAARLDVDIVHLAYPVPVRRGAFQCPTVVTLHDLYPYDIPENFGFPKVLFNRAFLRTCLERVDAVACVSRSTLSSLTSTFPVIAEKKALVIYNSVEQLAPLAVELPLSPPATPPFLLCVAQHRRNKNILLALRIFERLLRAGHLAPQTRLLIVGIPGPETPSIEEFVVRARLEKNVTLVNGISDAQLHWCYRNSSLLLAPSTIEGFGLPVAEALLAGCRVVCADIPAFREVGGSRCRYVPLGPQEVEAFAEAVRIELRQMPSKPIALPQYSAPVIAEGYMRLYRSHLPALVAEKGIHQARFAAPEERQRPI